MSLDPMNLRPPNRWKEFFDQLSEDELVELVQDAERFNCKQDIYGSLIHRKANEWITKNQLLFELEMIDELLIIQRLAASAYRHFCLKHFDIFSIDYPKETHDS